MHPFVGYTIASSVFSAGFGTIHACMTSREWNGYRVAQHAIYGAIVGPVVPLFVPLAFKKVAGLNQCELL